MAQVHRSPLIPDALPDFRNLGVMARILLAANAGAFVAAMLRAQTWAQLIEEVVNIALQVEPVLMGTLVLLWLLNAWLARQAYWRALGTVTLVVLVVNAGVQNFVARIDAEPQSQLRSAAFALLSAALLAGYFHLRNRAFSPALAEARLQALQARIRPHFLFNSLNAVLAMIRTDSRRAETALEDLAELYRVLMADNNKLIPLARELEITRQYLNLEQLRLGSRLIVEWHIEKAPLDALVPPLLLQPLVENGVYHGIEPGAGPGTIEIAIARYRDRVQLRLRNPYHPDYQHRQGNRMALTNIRERLALHFDVEATLEAGVKGDSYEIRMAMPYKRESP